MSPKAVVKVRQKKKTRQIEVILKDYFILGSKETQYKYHY